MTKLVQTQADLQEALRGSKWVLVPTMGALHAGHEALVDAAKRFAASESDCKVALSIFVNPLQFEEGSDFEAYPADLIDDSALATEWGVDLIWAPAEADIYGANTPAVRGDLDPGRLGAVLEGRSRPGHFAGVLRAVAGLFAAVKPQAAVFGEKDYQQLVLVKRLADQQEPPVLILAVETQRDSEGLALSSRLVRLSDESRREALAIPRALSAGELAAAQGSGIAGVVAAAIGELDSVAGVTPDYVEVVDENCEPLDSPGAGRLLVAANVQGVRLIDNASISLSTV